MTAVEEIKAKLDIVDIISETVSLKKSGQSYTGFCPFHQNTRTPSFVVFPHTQTWRCFGACAEGGDLFSYVMKRDGCDFKDALTTLAKQAGVTLAEPTAQTRQQDEYQRKLFELNAAAASHFHHLLLNAPAATPCRHYLAQRAFTPETIAQFQFGYAPNQWDHVKKHFLSRGYTVDDLLAVGLITQKDDGSSEYDRFRNRLMIPIRNRQSEVIGFGARALADDQIPKYLNSPQTKLFNKSETLYGLDVAHKAIRSSGEVVVVEGYMDVIQAHQQGAENVVAQMGTSLTEAQIKQLSVGSPKIILALDSDAAGNAATIRSLNLARRYLPRKQRATAGSQGIAFEAHVAQDIYVVPLPQGQDPDDVLRQGVAVWQALLEQALPSLDFYEQLIFKQTEHETPQGKSKIVHDLIPIYQEISDEVEKSVRTQQLARRLGVDERLLLEELKGTTVSQPKPQKKQPRPTLDSKKVAQVSQLANQKLDLEDYCLALILAAPSGLAIANAVLETQQLSALNINDFHHGENKAMFKSMQLWTAAESPQPEILAGMVGESLALRLNYLMERWHNQIRLPHREELHKDLQTTILQMRIENINKQVKELEFLQRQSDDEDTETRNHYIMMTYKFSQQRKQLDQTKNNLSSIGQNLVPLNHSGQTHTRPKH